MSKVRKHGRIKRPTVIITRSRCVKNHRTKLLKSRAPFYQQLKSNNHSLAQALTKEKEESQWLFTKNTQLTAEVQDLMHACNIRDHAITNIMKNAKNMMQMLVTMSGFLTSTISSCQEFMTADQINSLRASTSIGARDSIKRTSMKSPAKGVVKPMVSGHTITKPTINLSRVNMQMLQNPNLSVIEEATLTPGRNSTNRSVENRQSDESPQRLSVPPIRQQEEEDRSIVHRRTNRFSGSRSSRRYSKRNSGRLSGGGLTNRLSKRSSEFNQLIKSPRVSLLDVSRFPPNNQTLTRKELERKSVNKTNNSSVEDTEETNSSDSENIITPETQNSAETSEEDKKESNESVRKKSSISTKNISKHSSKNESGRQTFLMDSEIEDPQEGPSWLYNSTSNQFNGEQTSSPVTSLSIEKRRSSFRMPEIPKFTKVNTARLNLEDDMDSDENDDDNNEKKMPKCFITTRRGPSSKISVFRDDDEDSDEDDTLMINMKYQIDQRKQYRRTEPEKLNGYDVNELLQLTPLKPLLNINSRADNELRQVEVEPEPTVTVQLTQRCAPKEQETASLGHMSSLKLPQLPGSLELTRAKKATVNDTKCFNDMTTINMQSRVELPRLTDLFNATENNNHQQTQLIYTPPNKELEQPPKRKRAKAQPVEETLTVAKNSENEEEIELSHRKKTKQCHQNLKNKDPSSVKVVLQKLSDRHRSSMQNETFRSDHRSSDDSMSSTKSYADPSKSRPDPSSDSEGSTASYNSKPMSLRPRRQKAPRNLQEPSLQKKLRR